MNYYRRYSGDYLRDTPRLTLTEHGAYTLLLDYYYTSEVALPSDHSELYLMVRAMRPEDKKAVDKVLSLFFVVQPDGYHQKRADHEIAVSQKARLNGGKGGRPVTGDITGSITGMETGTLTGLETGEVTGQVTGRGGGSGHPPTTNHQPKEKSKAKARVAFAPPDWVPLEAWQNFEAMRSKIRKPMTDRARELVVAELERLKAQGHEPAAVLDQSTRMGWQDVYPIKVKTQQGTASEAAWYATRTGIEAKAKATGIDIPTDPSEWQAMRARVYAQHNITEAMVASAKSETAPTRRAA